jgi:hypothetical protein
MISMCPEYDYKAKPAEESDDQHFDDCLERDPRFLARIERARQSLRQGRGIRLVDVEV